MGIDWGAAPAPFDPVGANFSGQEEGLKLGQAKATIHALQGIDLSDPKSVDAGIGNLVHANAMEQGNALQNLAFTRQLRSQIPALMDKLTGSADSSQPAAQQPSVDPKHAIETFDMAKGAADKLLTVPQEQRPAAFAQIKHDMMARGIPEQAIDAAGADLSDQGLQSLSQHYAQLSAHASHQVNPVEGEAPEMPAAHPSSAWYNNVVNDPHIPLAVGLMKSAGIDFSPYLEQARALAMPTIQKNAEIAAAPTLAGIDVAKNVATAVGTAPIDVQKAVGIEAGTNPYKAALAKATADIAAAHDTINVPETDDKGEPTGRTITYRKDAALSAGAGGKPIGTAQSPAEATGKAADASTFMDRYKTEANQAAIQADVNARDVALAGAHMAQTLNPSNLTPWLAKNANTLNGLGIKIAAKDANNLGTYQNIVSQNLKNAIQVFPRNMGEFHAISDAAANAKSPGDAAALALTETAAIHDAQAQQKQFRVAWAAQNPGKYSEREFQTAWAQQPNANQSVFASPLFRDLKFNGKPAVTIYPQYTDGHVYGVFMPGTPQKTIFKVK